MWDQGTVLGGRYVLSQRIASGSMSDVWRARDSSLGREVAVKILLPALLDDDRFTERFRTEARVLASLRHPGIVTLHDFGESQDPRCAYLVMELLHGRTLSDILAETDTLSPVHTLAIVAQTLDALHAAHEKGIVHRDIKPANLVLDDVGRVTVTDFGVARSRSALRLTARDLMLGTALYSAPEQARSGPVTMAADLYAVGAVAYECLGGLPPFDGDDPLAIMAAHATGPVPDLPREIPAAVEDLVRRALAKDPGDRFPDAAAMASAARSVLDALTAAPDKGEAPRGLSPVLPPRGPLGGVPGPAREHVPAPGHPVATGGHDTSAARPGAGAHPAGTEAGGAARWDTFGAGGLSGGTDASALAELIAATDTVLPLTIALLGDWGTGKSSMMRRISRRVEELTGRARQAPERDPRASGDEAARIAAGVEPAVRQVHFNAWHLGEGPAWAGLVASLLPEPGRSSAPPESPTGRRAVTALARGRLGAAARLAHRIRNVTHATARVGRRPERRSTTPGAEPAAVSGMRAESRAAQRLGCLIHDLPGTRDHVHERDLLGQVHRCLADLADDLRAAATQWKRAVGNDPATAGPRPLSRVVVYIDDLDRCSPGRVADVLAAVHLVLALDLFVVVVAADPRWLVRCLGIDGPDQDGSPEAAVTPVDQLERIFDIPCGIDPPAREDARRYVDELLAVRAVHDEIPATAETAPDDGTSRSGHAPAAPLAPAAACAAPGTAPIGRPRALRLSGAERDLLLRLGGLLLTPRAAKRLVTLYRLVRAGTCAGHSHDAEDHSCEPTGEFGVIQILLLIIVAVPAGAQAILNAIMATPAGSGGLLPLLGEERPDTPDWERTRSFRLRLCGILETLPDAVTTDLGPYQRWAPHVVQYSFRTSPLLTAAVRP